MSLTTMRERLSNAAFLAEQYQNLMDTDPTSGKVAIEASWGRSERGYPALMAAIAQYVQDNFAALRADAIDKARMAYEDALAQTRTDD